MTPNYLSGKVEPEDLLLALMGVNGNSGAIHTLVHLPPLTLAKTLMNIADILQVVRSSDDDLKAIEQSLEPQKLMSKTNGCK